MRASVVFGAAAILAAAAGTAQAQGAGGGDSLNLLCTGTNAMLPVMPEIGSSYYRYSLAQSLTAAQLGVTIENGQVRVRPPKDSAPLFAKRSKDGWYDLTDVTVDRLTVKGRLKYNRVDRAKLAIDRRTGEATFGAFAGLCRVAPVSPEPTKF